MRPSRLLPLIAATAFGLVTGELSAQAPEAALVIAPEAPAPVRRIFTLAWAEERIPAALAATRAVVVKPAPEARDRIFTLAWQPGPSVPAPAGPVGYATASECRIVILVARSCAAR
jgi:hypothetical protein